MRSLRPENEIEVRRRIDEVELLIDDLITHTQAAGTYLAAEEHTRRINDLLDGVVAVIDEDTGSARTASSVPWFQQHGRSRRTERTLLPSGPSSYSGKYACKRGNLSRQLLSRAVFAPSVRN